MAISVMSRYLNSPVGAARDDHAMWRLLSCERSSEEGQAAQPPSCHTLRHGMNLILNEVFQNLDFVCRRVVGMQPLQVSSGRGSTGPDKKEKAFKGCKIFKSWSTICHVPSAVVNLMKRRLKLFKHQHRLRLFLCHNSSCQRGCEQAWHLSRAPSDSSGPGACSKFEQVQHNVKMQDLLRYDLFSATDISIITITAIRIMIIIIVSISDFPRTWRTRLPIRAATMKRSRSLGPNLANTCHPVLESGFKASHEPS